MKISRNCLNCNKKFDTEISKQRIKSGHGKYCSRRCAGEHSAIKSTGKPLYENRVEWPSEDMSLPNGSTVLWSKKFFRDGFPKVHVVCGKCNRDRIILSSDTKRQTFTGLCEKCSKRINHSRGEKHKDWKGGRHLNTGGYICINISSLHGRDREIASKMATLMHGKPRIVLEHRLVIAIHLNRPLLSSEVVHHKNGIKTDNRIENLEIVTHASHRQLDVKYHNLWKKAIEEISILKEQIARLSQGR